MYYNNNKLFGGGVHSSLKEKSMCSMTDNGNTTFAGCIQPTHQSEVEENFAPVSRWYILRYSTLTSGAKDTLLKSGHEVFLPLVRKKKACIKEGQPEYVIKPLIPKYTFVHAPYLCAKKLAEEVDFTLVKRRDYYSRKIADRKGSEVDKAKATSRKPKPESCLYHTISDEQMAYFMRAVELYKQNLQLSDIREIDLEQNDQVVILSGPFKGVRGYLKTTQGKNGGWVIVTLSFNDDDAQGKGSSSSARDKNLPVPSPYECLCYTIEATPDEIGILRFAGGKRHASDCIRNARQLVDKAMDAYIDGKPLQDDVRRQLNRYLSRFKETQFRSDKLHAAHLMLLYRIYVLLENPILRAVVREEIERDVLPAFDARIVDAQRRGRPDGAHLKEKYLKQMAQADEAPNLRQQKMQE